MQKKNVKKKSLSIFFGLALLILWHIIATMIDANYILPSPISVMNHLRENYVELLTVHFPLTMQVVCIGGAISIILGIGFAILMTVSPALEKAVYPVLTISQTVPTVCLTPIFILWLGYSVQMRVLVVVLMNFFAVTVNVFDGFQAVRPENKELLKTYGASFWQEFWILKVPTALPYFFTALKVSVPWAVVGAAVAEWFGAPGGLGSYSKKSMISLDSAGLIAPLVIISVTALVITGVIKLIEKKMITWEMEI